MKKTLARKCWVIVLAGGEGKRISSLIKQCLGFHCPKQYFRFCGKRSMLEHTNSRAVKLVGANRVITVIGKGHGRFLKRQRIRGQVIEQPGSRGNGAGVFLPLSYILARDPDAKALIFPSDHFVFPRNTFLRQVDQAQQLLDHFTDKLVLMAASPDVPETDYGWVEPGARLDLSFPAHYRKVRVVRDFHEKPSREKALQFLKRGYLWNTMIIAVKLQTLWSLGQKLLPRVTRKFESFREVLSKGQGKANLKRQRAALCDLYRSLPRFDFSSAFLAKAVPHTVIFPLDRVIWSDWGRPERVFETLRRMGKKPLFLTIRGRS